MPKKMPRTQALSYLLGLGLFTCLLGMIVAPLLTLALLSLGANLFLAQMGAALLLWALGLLGARLAARLLMTCKRSVAAWLLLLAPLLTYRLVTLGLGAFMGDGETFFLTTPWLLDAAGIAALLAVWWVWGSGDRQQLPLQ